MDDARSIAASAITATNEIVVNLFIVFLVPFSMK
jgi:hypothetical protein